MANDLVDSIILERVLLTIGGQFRADLWADSWIEDAAGARVQKFPPLTLELGFYARTLPLVDLEPGNLSSIAFIPVNAVWIGRHNAREIYEVQDGLFNAIFKGRDWNLDMIIWRVSGDSIATLIDDDTSLPVDASGKPSFGRHCKEYCPMIDDDLPSGSETFHATCGNTRGDVNICCRIKTRGEFNTWLQQRDFLRADPEPTLFSELPSELNALVSETAFALLFAD